MKYKFVIYYIVALLLIANLATAQTTNEWLNISNTPQCAADMSKPANSVFLTTNTLDTGVQLNNIAKEHSFNANEYVGRGLKYYKTRLNKISKEILFKLNDGSLSLIKSKSEAEQQWNEALVKSSNNSKLYFKNLRCFQVKEINAHYSNLFMRGINADNLTELAKNIKASTALASCDDEYISDKVELDSIYNYEFDVVNEKNWNTTGFDFWTSYKYYLSWAWKNTTFKTANQSYETVVKTKKFEEQVMLISNGCKSIVKPECNSYYLSSTELRQLFTTDRKKLELSSFTHDMQTSIKENNNKIEYLINSSLEAGSAENQWIKDFQRSYLGFSANNIENLYSANKFFSSLNVQKGFNKALTDLNQDSLITSNYDDMNYLCTEFTLLTKEEPFNFLAFDLKNLEKQSEKLDTYIKYGMNVSQIFSAFKATIPQIEIICQNYSKKMTTVPVNKFLGYKPWYKNFMSRFKLTDNDVRQSLNTLTQNSDKTDITASEQLVLQKPLINNYLNGLCASAIDCHRQMLEHVVNLNKLVLHSKIFIRDDITSAPLFNELSEKVTCGIYDPWEAKQLNRKKLIADIASSVLFGWTSLPIYLDLNFKPKELTSMKSLIDENHVKFDMTFDKNQIDKTLAVNFGALFNIPCSISFSQTGQNITPNAGSGQYMFSGLKANACVGTKNKSLDAPNGKLGDHNSTPTTGVETCLQCEISFKQVSKMNLLNVFSPLRFLMRIADSFTRYQNIKNDDTINPREFNINQRYLVEAFDKYKTIPEHCVPLLARGLKCQSNLCEALAVKEFEIKTGLIVDDVSLTLAHDNEYQNSGSYNWATFKIKGQNHDIRMSCQPSGQSFYMYMSSRQIEKIKQQAGSL